jgi:thymidylate kinase
MRNAIDCRRALVVKVDGIDGCGKTTLIKSLQAAYGHKYRVLVTSEFSCDLDNLASTVANGQFTVSRILNKLAKCPSGDLDDIERELLWAVASRRVNRLVIPRELPFFDLILVDRSNFGNLTYGLVLDPRLECVFSLATNPIEVADLVFWIDTPVEICQLRLMERSERDVIEAKGIEFFNLVRDKYEDLAMTNPNFKRLDGTEDVLTLTADAIKVIRATGRLDLSEDQDGSASAITQGI